MILGPGVESIVYISVKQAIAKREKMSCRPK